MSADHTLSQTLDTLSRRALNRAESERIFASLVAGQLTDVEIAALLIAIKTRGETPDMVAGAGDAIRRAAVEFPKPDYPVADPCGTGGDGTGTVNISTAAAFVAAEGGVPIAKHGNRATSSRCGSADLLETLGVKLDPSPAVARRCLDEAGLCFLFAPAYHPGVRHATPVRRALKTRTIFNLVGPVANPARPEYQVLGIYQPSLCRPMAATLQMLGCRSALVVHGDGLDEIALHGPTLAAWLHDGIIEEISLSPEDAGLPRASIAELAGGAPEENAAWLTELLAGRGTEAHTNAVAINAGAMLWITGRASDFRSGAQLARELIRSGAAGGRIGRLAELSHGA